MSSNELSKPLYHISVNAISLTPLLFHYTVDSFSIIDGLVTFIDNKTNKRKWFPVDRVMVEEV